MSGGRNTIHACHFSSDHEMMTFYLTLNRFINPASYLVERSDRQRLEDLENVLFGNVAAFEAVHHFKKISVKDVIKGFGMHMMNMQVSNTNRMQSANIMGSFIDCIIDTTKIVGNINRCTGSIIYILRMSDIY